MYAVQFLLLLKHSTQNKVTMYNKDNENIITINECNIQPLFNSVLAEPTEFYPKKKTVFPLCSTTYLNNFVKT